MESKILPRNKIFLFDVDGTLTAPRQQMTSKFKELFKKVVKSHLVYLVSGSDIGKIREQIPKSILKKCAGIFASSANEFWIKDELQYENVYIPSQSVVAELEGFLHKSHFRNRTSNHIEHRPGMINFSVVGRAANQKERDNYARWDARHQERKKMAITLIAKYPEIDVTIGGEISIDIYPLGLDKSQAVEYIREAHSYNSIVFFGDRIDEDGNDFSIVEVLKETDIIHAVENFQDTYNVLQNYLGE